MNKYIFTICLTLIILQAHSQNVRFRLFAEDAIGRRDTVVLGVSDTSTFGMDSSLGEVNIYGMPYGNLDMRVVQRDSSHFRCLYFPYSVPRKGIYFKDNIDSKVDLRPDWSYYEIKSRIFEVSIHATNYPIVIHAEAEEVINSLYGEYSVIFSQNTQCEFIDEKHIGYDFDGDSLFVLMSDSIQSIIVYLDHEVGLNELNSNNNLLNLYPNPVKDILNVHFRNASLHYSAILIRNSLGQPVYSANLFSSEVNLAHLSPGLYFIEVSDGVNVIRQRFIKQ